MIILKIILVLVLLGIAAVTLFVGGLAIWAKNYKLGIPSSAIGLLALIEIYETVTYAHPVLFWLIFIAFVLMGIAATLYVIEPELGVIDWFKSPEKLIKEGKKDKAAIKYRRKKMWREAAKLYEELGWYTSASICYEELGDWKEVARLYEILAEKEEHGDYYLRRAKEIYEEKLGDLKRAAEILEKLAQIEEWYWDDAAKMWEKVGDKERALKCWETALEVNKKRATEEDGVFWSDVADICERLGRIEEAIEAYKKFLEYAIKMDEEEGKGWIRHVAETYYALYRLTGDEEYKKKGDEAFEKYKAYLDEVVVDENYKKELLEEVKRWQKERVELEI